MLLHVVQSLHLQFLLCSDVLVREGLFQVFDRVLFDHMACSFFALLDDRRFGLGGLFVLSLHARLLLDSPHLLDGVLG